MLVLWSYFRVTEGLSYCVLPCRVHAASFGCDILCRCALYCSLLLQRVEAVLGSKLLSSNVRHIRNVSPGKDMMCVSFPLPPSVAGDYAHKLSVEDVKALKPPVAEEDENEATEQEPPSSCVVTASDEKGQTHGQKKVRSFSQMQSSTAAEPASDATAMIVESTHASSTCDASSDDGLRSAPSKKLKTEHS